MVLVANLPHDAPSPSREQLSQVEVKANSTMDAKAGALEIPPLRLLYKALHRHVCRISPPAGLDVADSDRLLDFSLFNMT